MQMSHHIDYEISKETKETFSSFFRFGLFCWSIFEYYRHPG